MKEKRKERKPKGEFNDDFGKASVVRFDEIVHHPLNGAASE